jgi:hypothetical protein
MMFLTLGTWKPGHFHANRLVRCTCAEHCALHHGQRSCVSSGSRALGLPGIHPYWWCSSHLPLALRLRIFTVRFVEVKKNIHSNFLPLKERCPWCNAQCSAQVQRTKRLAWKWPGFHVPSPGYNNVVSVDL